MRCQGRPRQREAASAAALTAVNTSAAAPPATTDVAVVAAVVAVAAGSSTRSEDVDSSCARHDVRACSAPNLQRHRTARFSGDF